MSPDTLLGEGGADPRIGMVLQDRYKIVRKLGEGGMGAVYEGEHVLIKRRVAIKCLHAHYANSPEIVARFHREALAATSIRHPNIVEVTDMGRFPDGAFFMVLEFLDGRDWAADLARTGAQSLGRVVHIMAQVCDALAAAHEKGIVHRDLKPENVFLIRRGDDDSFAKVLDFGISKMQDSPGDPEAQARSKGLTRTGMAMGTPYYMAPEQAQGRKDIDHRADIYALGVILFQALTTQYPFDDESYPMLVVKICTQEAPPIVRWRPDLPEPVQALIASMLAKKPSDRPATCADVKAALAPYRGHGEAPVIPSDAGSTANLSVGTFGEGAGAQVASAPAAPPSTPVIPMTTPAGVAAAQAAPPPGATGPLPGTPAMRMSGGTPFASPDDGPESRASLAPREDGSRTGLMVGGAVVATLLVVGIAGAAYLAGGGSGAGTTPSEPTATTQPSIALPTPPPVVPVPTPPDTRAAEPTPAPPAPVATVRVQISTQPEDAEIYLDDHRIGNPFDADLPQTVEPRNLRVQREGYTTRVMDLVLEFPQRLVVRLTRGRGVEDRSSAATRAAARTPTAPAAPRDEHETAPRDVEVRVQVPAVAVPAVEPPPPRAETPTATEDTTAPPEGQRRTLKNPFGHR